MKFGVLLLTERNAAWSRFYINYEKLKRIIKYSSENDPTGNSFFASIDKELEKIVRFYNNKRSELNDQLVGLSRKAGGLAAIDLENLIQNLERIQTVSPSAACPQTDISKRNINITATMQTYFKDVETLLETAVSLQSEVYLLKEFVRLNYTGFRKILKKYDKKCMQQSQKIYLKSKVNFQPFTNLTPLHEMDTQITKLIAQLKAYSISLRAPNKPPAAHPDIAAAISNNNTSSATGNIIPYSQDIALSAFDVGEKNLSQLKMISDLSDVLEHYNKISPPTNNTTSNGTNSGTANAIGHQQQRPKKFGYVESCTIANACDLVKKINNPAAVQEFFFRACKDNRFELVKALLLLPQCAHFANLKYTFPQHRSFESNISSNLAFLQSNTVLKPHPEFLPDDHLPLTLSPYATNFPHAAAPRIGANENLLTPVHISCVNNNPDMLRFLIGKGADLNALDSFGKTVFHYAASKPTNDCLCVLLDHFECLAMDSSESLVSLAQTPDSEGFTPFFYAILNRSISCVRLLLERKITSPSSVISYTETPPLFYACASQSLENTLLLLEHHANPNATDEYGVSCLHLACRFGNMPLLTLLLNHGADVAITDFAKKTTPIFDAISRKHLDCVKALLEHGASLDVLERRMLSPIDYAIFYNSQPIYNYLIDHQEMQRQTPMEPTPQNLSLHSNPIDPRIDPFTDQRPTSMIQDTTAFGSQPSGNKMLGLPKKRPASHSSSPVPSNDNPAKEEYFELPPPAMLIKHHGHSFLKNKHLLLINLSKQPFFERKPEKYLRKQVIRFFDEEFGHYNVKLEMKIADDKQLVMLPLENYSQTYSLNLVNLDLLKLELSVYAAFGTISESSLVAKTVLLSASFCQQKGFITAPLYSPSMSVVGTLTFEYYLVSPYPFYQHESATGLSLSLPPNNPISNSDLLPPNKKPLATGSNSNNNSSNKMMTQTQSEPLMMEEEEEMHHSIGSFGYSNAGVEFYQKRARQSYHGNVGYWKAYAVEPVSDTDEFRSQVEEGQTKPTIIKTSLKKAYTTLSLYVTKDLHFIRYDTDTLYLEPLVVPIHCLPLRQFKSVLKAAAKNADVENDNLDVCCLEVSLKYTDTTIPFHLRFPRSSFYTYPFKNTFIDALITLLSKYAKRRPIVVSSDDIEFCLLFNSKQSHFPCFIEANSSTSIHSCLSFAASNLMLGAIVQLPDLLKSPKMYDLARSMGVLLLTKTSTEQARSLGVLSQTLKADGLFTNNILSVGLHRTYSNLPYFLDHCSRNIMTKAHTSIFDNMSIVCRCDQQTPFLLASNGPDVTLSVLENTNSLAPISSPSFIMPAQPFAAAAAVAPNSNVVSIDKIALDANGSGLRSQSSSLTTPTNAHNSFFTHPSTLNASDHSLFDANNQNNAHHESFMGHTTTLHSNYLAPRLHGSGVVQQNQQQQQHFHQNLHQASTSLSTLAGESDPPFTRTSGTSTPLEAHLGSIPFTHDHLNSEGVLPADGAAGNNNGTGQPKILPHTNEGGNSRNSGASESLFDFLAQQ